MTFQSLSRPTTFAYQSGLRAENVHEYLCRKSAKSWLACATTSILHSLLYFLFCILYFTLNDLERNILGIPRLLMVYANPRLTDCLFLHATF